MTKEELRQDLKKERGKVPRHRRKLWDRAIFEHLSALPRYAQAQKVMIYLSIGWEVDTWALVQDLQARGKEIYVPVVQKEPRALLAAPFVSREDLVPAAFGILEPALRTPPIDAGKLDFVVVPGLAFSEGGFRVGYGGGYYDRFLATTKAQSAGLVYRSFVRELPTDPWDHPVDFLVTEDGVLGRK